MNTGIMAAFRERNEMVAIFTGHDHKNDFSVDYDNVLVGYTRKTGYGSYGPADGKLHGGRILKIQEQPFRIETYIIQEDGTVDKQEPQPDKGVKQDMCHACILLTPFTNTPSNSCGVCLLSVRCCWGEVLSSFPFEKSGTKRPRKRLQKQTIPNACGTREVLERARLGEPRRV